MSAELGRRCEECGGRLQPAQSYCLSCRARAGAPSSPRLPPPKVWLALALVFLGFGVLIGRAARSSVQDQLAASLRPRLRVLLPAPSAAPPSSAASPSAGSSSPPEAPEASAAAEASAAETGKPPAAPAGANASAPAKPPARAHAAPGRRGGAPGASEATPSRPASTLPAIKHVFLIMLSDQPYAAAFGPESVAHYLTRTLEPQGALLARYDAVAHQQLADEIALLSGQGPTAETAANCPTFSDIAPASSGAQEQVLGDGCVYPASTPTLPGQLEAKHLTWRAYVEGIDETGAGAGPCAHPALGAERPDGGGRRQRRRVLHVHQPVRLLLVDRRRRMRRRRRRAQPPEGRSRQPRANPELRLYRSQPLRRRQPHAVHARCTRGTRARRCLPAAGGAGDHRLQRLQAERPARDHDRPGALQRRIRRLERLLRSAELPEPAVRRHGPGRAPGARRGQRRCSAALALHQGARHEPGALQPLLAARHDRGRVRPHAPRLRRASAVKPLEAAIFNASPR